MVPFADSEDVIMALLDPAVAPAVQTTGSNFTPPLVQVRQTGGASTQLQSNVLVEVGFFGADYPAARQLAARGEELILAARASTVYNVPGHPNGVYVDRTEIVASPRDVAYEDRDKRRKTLTCRIVMRRPRSS